MATKSLLNRSHVFKRAWQLKRWNPDTSETFGHWLKFAWTEYRDGTAGAWSFEPRSRAGSLTLEIERLERQHRLNVHGLNQLSAVRTELVQLAA